MGHHNVPGNNGAQFVAMAMQEMVIQVMEWASTCGNQHVPSVEPEAACQQVRRYHVGTVYREARAINFFAALSTMDLQVCFRRPGLKSMRNRSCHLKCTK